MRKLNFIVVAAAAVLSAGALWAQIGPGGVVGGTRPATRGSGLISGSGSGSSTAAAVAQPAVPIVSPKTFKAVPADPIERAEYNTKSKSIEKNLTSAMAMMVMVDTSGEETGHAADVIAAMAAGSRQIDPMADVLSNISNLGGDPVVARTHPELKDLADTLKDKTTGERDEIVRKAAEALLADTTFVRTHAALAKQLRDKLDSTQSPFVMVKKQAAVGNEMQTSFDEAVRAVKMRYPVIDPGKMEFSFGDKYTPHEGGSAGTCFGVMMLSALEGYEIDPKCAVTGDITVDWKVRKIGGVAAKLRGAAADKCLYAGVPLDNRENIADMALFYGDASIREIQVFSMATLQDAVALLRKDRSPQLTEAMKEFTDLLPRLRGGKGTYSLATNQKVLENIVALAPNHESAKMMLEMGKGTFPKTLTPMFATEVFGKSFVPYLMIFALNRPITRATIPQALTTTTKKDLSVLSGMAPAELIPLVRDMQGVVDLCENIAQGQTREDLLRPKLDILRGDLQKLQLDKNFAEKLKRAGF